MKLYGIKNCDTVSKARKYLTAADVKFDFFDVRSTDGKLSDTQINSWLDYLGDDWAKLVNKKSTSWKDLSDMQRKNLSRESAVGMILANPTLMKRPVLAKPDGTILVGFQPATYAAFIES